MCTSTHDVHDVKTSDDYMPELPDGMEWPKTHASWRFSGPCDTFEKCEAILEGYDYYLCKEIGSRNGKVHFHVLTLEHHPVVLERLIAFIKANRKVGKNGKCAPCYDTTTNGTFASALRYFTKDKEFRYTFKFPYHEHCGQWVKRVRADTFYSLTEQNLLGVIRKIERERNRKFDRICDALDYIYENTEYRASANLRYNKIPQHIIDEFNAKGKRGWARNSINKLLPLEEWKY